MKDTKGIDKSTKMAVVLHLYYRDLWEEIKSYLLNIPIEFDLFISICDNIDGVVYDSKDNIKIQNEISNTFPNTNIKIFPNLGRDVGPFLEIINNMDLNYYDIILKLHSKKSKTAKQMGELWRKQLFSSLIKNTETCIKNIKELLREDIGILGCGHNLNTTSMMGNRLHLDKLYNILDIDTSKRNLEFFAGTMFFIKPIVLKKLKNKFTINDFVENGALDGNLEHAIERIFINLCRDAGYDISYNYSNIITGLPFQNYPNNLQHNSFNYFNQQISNFNWKDYLK